MALKTTIEDIINTCIDHHGCIISNIDLPAVLAYIAEHEKHRKFRIDFNDTKGKTRIMYLGLIS